jgi:osmotically-inducible protein OsmY
MAHGVPGAGSEEYRIAHFREHLARGETAELGVRVELHGGAVTLTGTVTTADRRDEILRLARTELTGLTVHEDVVVACADAPDQYEELS